MTDQRSLTRHESDVLELVLKAIPGSAATRLEGQVKSVVVVGGIPTLLDLQVAPGAMPADVPDGPLPSRAIVEATDGQPEGEILVWVTSGYLSGLEYAWFTDEAPTDFPAADRVRIQDPRGGMGAPP